MADETIETNEEVVESPEESTEVEETEPAQDEEVAEEVEEEPEPPKEDKPSRRESLRIQKLVSQLKQQRPEQPYRPSQGLDYGQALEADPETIKQLEADRRGYAERAYADGIKQAATIQFHTRLEIDAPKMEQKYPLLDKTSPQFNAAVADAINTMYLSTAGYDPQSNSVQNSNIRYSDYVESVMELVDAAAGDRAVKTTKNIAKQAATTGLRPDGSSAKRLNLNQAPQSMSDDELDAVIAQAIPKR